jgi:hypothetical protein
VAEATIGASLRSFSTGGGTTHTSAGTIVVASGDHVYVGVCVGAGSPEAPIHVRIGGSGGTDIVAGKLSADQAYGTYGMVNFYCGTAVPAGTHTVYVEWANSQDEQLIVAFVVQNPDTGTPRGTVATATGGNTDPTVNAVSSAGKLCVDFVGVLNTGGQINIDIGAGQTQIQRIQGADTGNEAAASSSETAAGASTTMSYARNPGATTIDGWGLIAFALNGASGGGGGISIPVVQGYRRMMQMR